MNGYDTHMVDTIREVLTGSSSSAIDEAEAKFRRKAWLALAPLYGVPPFEEELPNDTDTDDRTYSDLEETVIGDIERGSQVNEEKANSATGDDVLTDSNDSEETTADDITGKVFSGKQKEEAHDFNVEGAPTTAPHDGSNPKCLLNWYAAHESNPYPTKEEIQELALSAKCTEDQVNTWFIRQRHMVSMNNAQKFVNETWRSNANKLQGKVINDATQDDLTDNSDSKEKDYKTKGVPARAPYHVRNPKCLLDWFEAHKFHPYPTKEEKEELALAADRTVEQVHTWFIRRRQKFAKENGKKFCNGSWRFPKFVVDHLKQWCEDHQPDPKPTQREVHLLSLATKLSEEQIIMWIKRYETKKKKKDKGNILGSHEGYRYPRHIVDCLKKWYDDHKSNPHPTDSEKLTLSTKTGLTKPQIGAWLYHYRMKHQEVGPTCEEKEVLGSNQTEKKIVGTKRKENEDDVCLSHDKRSKIDDSKNGRVSSSASDDGIEHAASNCKRGDQAVVCTKQGVPTDDRHNARNPTCVLYNWYAEHESNPYPTKEEKHELALDAGLTLQQVSFWFDRQRCKSGKTQKQSVTGPLEVVYPKLLDEKNLKPTRLQVDKLKLVANEIDAVLAAGHTEGPVRRRRRA